MGLTMQLVRRAAVAGLALVMLAACYLPLGLGLPSTRALEDGAAGSLDAAKSFRITGSYIGWTIDLELVAPATKHALLSDGKADLEAVIVGPNAFFRGQKFLAAQMGADPFSQSLVKATGNSWWVGASSFIPEFPDFTSGSGLKATFLGTAVTSRTDHVSVAGVAAVELSGPRGDVFIGEAPPYDVLRVHMGKGATVDGIARADFRYGDYGRDFGIAVPSGAVNFSDLSTLPPIYSVVLVDTSGCGSPCVISASLKNLGGRQGARGPSTVTFTMTEPQTKAVIGACTATVQPDVDHSATTTASCTIAGVNGGDHNAAVVAAVPDNPGRA